jgi:cytochrome P450
MRYANRNTTLPVGGGPDGKSPVFVAKGQLIVYGVFSLHRRKDLYGEDADEYRPERWDGLRVSYEYLPFSAGPRVCIGKQFALTEAAYTLVRLVQEFKGIENRDSTPWLERFHLTLSSNSGVQVALHPRM